MNQEDLHLELNTQEQASALWQKLERYFAAKLEEARLRNDADLDEKATARMRERIAVYRGLLDLGRDLPDFKQ